jgi:hypothetical protein
MLNIFPQPMCSGDVYPLKMTFTLNNAAVDLTGSTFGMTIKNQPIDSDDITESVQYQNVTGDTTGIINFVIGPLPAGTYWMDVKKWLTGPPTSMRTTILAPLQLKIVQSVTTRPP